MISSSRGAWCQSSTSSRPSSPTRPSVATHPPRPSQPRNVPPSHGLGTVDQGQKRRLTGRRARRPHLLPPAQILAAHLAARLAPHQSALNARLQTTQARNAVLARAVAAQRAELDALLARLDDAVADVAAANLALGPVADDLAQEARAAATADDDRP